MAGQKLRKIDIVLSRKLSTLEKFYSGSDDQIFPKEQKKNKKRKQDCLQVLKIT